MTTSKKSWNKSDEFETARILFLGEVFAAVAVFVAYGR